MQPPATDIVVAHAPAEASLASYYAIALRTQGSGSSPFSPPAGQSPQAIVAQIRNSRALVVLVTDPMPTWAGALVTGYRELAATERWRRIVVIRRGAGQLSPEMQGLPWIEATDKPVEEVATEVLALLAGTPVPRPIPVAAPPAQIIQQPLQPVGPPQWPTAQPMPKSLGDDVLTRRALLFGGLGVAALGAVALATSAVLTRGFGAFASPAATSGPGGVPPLIFTSSDTMLYAIDLGTGKQRWRFTADAQIRAALISSHGIIYAASAQGTMYAINTADGKPHWSNKSIGPTRVRPIEANGVLYIGSDDNNVYAVKTTDGSVVWKTPTNDAVQCRPSVVNGVVYVGSHDGNLYALDASSGKRIWKFQTGGAVISAPAVGQDLVFVGSDDHNIWSLHLADGRHHWNFTTGASVSSSPSVTSDTVYVGSQDGGIYAVQVDSPVMRWRFRTGGPVASSPIVDSDVIYVGSNDHKAYAIGTDGNKRWSHQTGGNVNGRFALANGVVYANSDKIYALNASSGAEIWTFAADANTAYSSPSITV